MLYFWLVLQSRQFLYFILLVTVVLIGLRMHLIGSRLISNDLKTFGKRIHLQTTVPKMTSLINFGDKKVHMYNLARIDYQMG
jgi:hypothetical protein